MLQSMGSQRIGHNFVNNHHPASEGSKHVRKKKSNWFGTDWCGTQVFTGYPKRGLSGYIEKILAVFSPT